jgi:hypothetical protein
VAQPKGFVTRFPQRLNWLMPAVAAGPDLESMENIVE